MQQREGPGASPHARLRPVAGARITGGLWAGRQRLNRERLLVDGEARLAEAGAFENLRAAARGGPGPHQGFVYSDSDLYKWVEALGWELGREPSEDLARRADAAIELLAAAQDADGYLNTCLQLTRPRAERFTNLAWDHELYCAGHLIQAGIAHARGREDVRLLAVARRLADHVDGVFGPGRRAGTDGHPEIELALVELARHTGERRLRDLAAFFLDQRGHGTLQPAHFGSAYFQDHVPVRAAREVEGHAVRALYLAAGVTDLHLETGERALLEASLAQWEDMTAAKTYLTGGVGARHRDEAFGDPYELPPDRCYGETCAAIASVLWSWRLLLATGEARFADLIERTLLNGVLAGVALDGSGYAYVNPLHVRPGRGGPPRFAWFPCACCPPNVMRLLASVQHYLATADAGGLQVHQYASGELSADGRALRVSTDYPWDGRVELEVVASGEDPWTLSLRVPAWCGRARLDVAGEGGEAGPGYARVRRRWRAGERVTLDLPLVPRLTAPHPRIDAVRGCLAIERGPLVLCVEGADVDDLALDPSQPLVDEARPDLLGGVVAVRAGAVRRAAADWRGWPYAPAPGPDHPAPHVADGGALLAVPYALWGNRGETGMRVWLPALSGGPP